MTHCLPKSSHYLPRHTAPLGRAASFLLLIFTLFNASLHAQSPDIIVKGRVTNEKGQSLEGASVTGKGNSIGVTTDNQGRFTINLAMNEGVLLISHVGYQTQEGGRG